MIGKKEVRNSIFIFLVVIIGLSLFVIYTEAEAGNYCVASPCSCGSACQDGGNEVANGYNTIDSCQDGSEDSYEYVHDITVTDLNGSTFIGGHTVEIDAHVECDIDGDEISFVYHNGTAWRSFHDVTCAVDGKAHYYKNLTLDDISDNHTIRITLAFSGTTGMICSYNEDTIYADTDDVQFRVQSSSVDLVNPRVFDITPLADEEFGLNSIVNITANVTDNFGVSNVTANVSWGSENQLVSMLEISGLYQGNFTNTTDITTYDVTIIAYDSSGNLNNTETTQFLVNTTTNITILYPENRLYPSTGSRVEYEIGPGQDIDATWVEIEEDVYFSSNKRLSNILSNNTFETNFNLSNISQSFFVTQDMYVDKISLKLKRNGTGTINTTVEIRNSTSGLPSNISLATAEVNSSNLSESFAWVNLTLNQTIQLKANTSYWLFLTPNGSSTDFVSWEANLDLYSLGNYSQNDSKDLLFKVFDKYRYNLSFTPSQGTTVIRAYANISGTEVSSSSLTVYYDFTAPNIYAYDISPDDPYLLDPYSQINVSANITDNLKMEEVLLHYRKEGETDFANVTMANYTGLYEGNFSVPDQTNVTIKITGQDTSGFGLLVIQDTVELFYDTNWTIYPIGFNTTGAVINTNTSVGELTIISNADYNYTYNLSAISSRDIFFNGSNETQLTVMANKNSTLEIKAVGAPTEQSNPVSINILNLNNSESRQINFTLVTSLSGPYFYVDIIEYDSSVTQGDHVSSLRARISNVGNETAHNLTALWTLPSGWTSRDDLNRSYANLSEGGVQTIDFKISADVGSSASTGQKTISFFVNCSENVTGSDSRTVTVNSESGDEEPDGGGSSSTTTTNTGPAGGVVVAPPDLSTDLVEIKVPRGKIYETEFNILNDESVKTYYNISLEIDGLFNIYYNMTPRNIARLRTDDSQKIKLVFNLPEYFSEGTHELKLIIDPINTDTIEKDFKLIVYDDRVSLISCLNNSLKLINLLKDDGVNVYEWEQRYDKELQNYNKGNYESVRDFCEEINKYYEKYVKQKQGLISLTSRVIQLKDEGYKTSEIENFLRILNNTFYQGNFDKVNELMVEADLLIETATSLQKPLSVKIRDFVDSNKTLLVVLLITVPLLVFGTKKVVYITSTENRIKELEKEKEKVISLMKKAQQNYFKDSFINKSLYDSYVQNYRERIGKLNAKLAQLRLAKMHYLKPASKEKILRNQKDELQTLIKDNQDNYYNKRIIDYESYSQQETFYTNLLSEVESKLPEEKEETEEEIIAELEGKTTKFGEQQISMPVSEQVSFSVTEQVQETEFQESPQKVLVYFDEDKGEYTKQVDLKKKKDKRIKSKGKENKKKKKIDEDKFKKLDKPEEYFYLADGIILKSIPDLYHATSIMDNSVFKHHVSKERNDFALWVEGVFEDDKLANDLLRVKTKSQMKKVLEEHMGGADE